MPAQNLRRTDEGGIYLHVFNKGIENRAIFRDEDDFRVFLGFLEEYLSARKDAESVKKEFSVNGRTFRGVPHQPKNYLGKVELLAYNLQPDHFHLLLHQKTRKSLQGFIRSLCTRYSMYFNKKYKHTGTLFEGPYKSVQIEDKTLPLLTHYLHKNGDYSTFPEYSKLKNTSWVRTKIVLSIKNGNDNFQDYQGFIKKFEPNKEEIDQLKKIVIEKFRSHLEGSNLSRDDENYFQEIPTESSEEIYIDSDLKPLQRIPEFLGMTVVFFLLLTFGVRNVIGSTIQSPQPSTLGTDTVVSITKSPQPLQVPPAPSTSSAVLKTEEIKPKIMLIIDAKDASASVNIRQEPASYSKNIGKTKNGDTFEFVSFDSTGWYGVKLPDGSIGFISAEYVIEEHK